MSEKTIGQALNLDPSIYMRNSKTFQTRSIPLVNPDLIVGLELEIENFDVDNIRLEFSGVNFTEDGSLRNNGYEGVTEPLYTKHVEDLLTRFFKHFKITEEKNYSDRCSLHVHVNVCNLTWDQLASVVLLYQVFERGLFTYVGQDRDKNIFCVPWCHAVHNVNLVNIIRNQDLRSLKNWAKYTALNLLPILGKGSIEFRHLHGTCNIAKIMEWLNLIGCIFKYGVANSVEDLQKIICDLNTSSAYDVFLRSVFGEYSGVLLAQDGFNYAMEQGVIDCKLMLTSTEGLIPKEKKAAPANDADALLNDLVFDPRVHFQNVRQEVAELRRLADVAVRPGVIGAAGAVPNIRMDELRAQAHRVLLDNVGDPEAPQW